MVENEMLTWSMAAAFRQGKIDAMKYQIRRERASELIRAEIRALLKEFDQSQIPYQTYTRPDVVERSF
jgi:hypothetical protein